MARACFATIGCAASVSALARWCPAQSRRWAGLSRFRVAWPTALSCTMAKGLRGVRLGRLPQHLGCCAACTRGIGSTATRDGLCLSRGQRLGGIGFQGLADGCDAADGGSLFVPCRPRWPGRLNGLRAAADTATRCDAAANGRPLQQRQPGFRRPSICDRGSGDSWHSMAHLMAAVMADARWPSGCRTGYPMLSGRKGGGAVDARGRGAPRLHSRLVPWRRHRWRRHSRRSPV